MRSEGRGMSELRKEEYGAVEYAPAGAESDLALER